MNVYKSTDYRKILAEIVESRKKLDPKFTYQILAESCRIQKAYLSQVIRGHRDLNQDQLYLACQHLELPPEQIEYMKLLLEYARTGLQARKRELKAQINKIQKEKNQTAAHVKLNLTETREHNRDLYYLEPFNQIVHVALGVKDYRENPKQLAEDMGIPVEKVQESLRELERMAIIAVEKGKIVDLAPDLHLPRKNPLFKAWRNALIQLSLARSKVTNDDKSYNFTVVFTADENTRAELHAQFMKFLAKAKKLVSEAPARELFQMNFDLMSWTKTSNN